MDGWMFYSLHVLTCLLLVPFCDETGGPECVDSTLGLT